MVNFSLLLLDLSHDKVRLLALIYGHRDLLRIISASFFPSPSSIEVRTPPDLIFSPIYWFINLNIVFILEKHRIFLPLKDTLLRLALSFVLMVLLHRMGLSRHPFLGSRGDPSVP
jgi:hypothetical protein